MGTRNVLAVAHQVVIGHTVYTSSLLLVLANRYKLWMKTINVVELLAQITGLDPPSYQIPLW